MIRTIAVLLVASLALTGPVAGCSRQKGKPARQSSSELTEGRRDSTIAASKLPGANAVGRAMAVSDSADARAKRLNEGQ